MLYEIWDILEICQHNRELLYLIPHRFVLMNFYVPSLKGYMVLSYGLQ